MKIVYKYTIAIDDVNVIKIPQGAKILSVGSQRKDERDNTIQVWALVDTKSFNVMRRFFIRGTGHPVDFTVDIVFIGTVIDGPFVWHVFDGGEV